MRPLLFLLAAVNPPYLLAALPSRGRLGAAVVSSAVALLAVVAAAGWSGPMLDALDVSPSTFRIAAGVIMIGGGLVRMLDPAAQAGSGGSGDSGGWRAGLVPLAFPLLLAPDVLLLAVSLGADHGVPATAAAATVALGVFVVASVMEPRDSPVVPGLARLLAAALVVGGVVLGVDGIQDL